MNIKLIRKTHRYLGLFIGIQFLFWTISGLYFSWTDIDKIHGDHFKVADSEPHFYTDLFPLSELELTKGIQNIELREIDETPYYWINNEDLYSAKTGTIKDGISEKEALGIAQKYLISTLKVKNIELITEVGKHHEYRGRALPAYVISYNGQDGVKAYVSKVDGEFQTVRHRSWRWFDYLWMMHTMDYQGRDNFNTLLLRGFSLFGLLTVLSGFALWMTWSPTLRKLTKRGSADTNL